MTFYYILYFCIPLVYGISIIITKKDNNRFFLVVMGIILATVSASRNVFIGTDTITYYNIFNWISGFNGSIKIAANQSNIEYGYLYLNRLVYYLNGSFKCLLIIVSVVTIISIMIFISLYSLNFLMSIIIFLGFTYYFMSFNISRQFLAVSLGLLAACFIKFNRKYISLALIIFASTIHTSAIAFIFLWILTKVKISKKKFLLMLGGGIVLAFPSVRILSYIMQSSERYSHFLSDTTNAKSITGILLVLGLIGVFVLLVSNFDFNHSKEFDLFMLYGMALIVIVDVLNIFFPFMGRIKYVFEPIIMVILPYTLIKAGVRRYMFVFNIILFILGIIMITKLIPNNIFYGITPYSVGFNY